MKRKILVVLTIYCMITAAILAQQWTITNDPANNRINIMGNGGGGIQSINGDKTLVQTLTGSGGITITDNGTGGHTIAGGGSFTQVNSDWNATTGVAAILNKPPLTYDGTESTFSSPLLINGTSSSVNGLVVSGTQSPLKLNSADGSRWFQIGTGNTSNPMLYSSTGTLGIAGSDTLNVGNLAGTGTRCVHTDASGNLSATTGDCAIAGSITAHEVNNSWNNIPGFFIAWTTGATCQTLNNGTPAGEVCSGNFTLPNGYRFNSTWYAVCSPGSAIGSPTLMVAAASDPTHIFYSIKQGTADQASVSGYNSLTCMAFGT